MRKTIKKGDVVKYCPGIHKYKEGFRYADDYGKTGIVISVRKKEVTRNKSKHVLEVVIAHTAEIMWDTGTIESDVPVDHVEMISRTK